MLQSRTLGVLLLVAAAIASAHALGSAAPQAASADAQSSIVLLQQPQPGDLPPLKPSDLEAPAPLNWHWEVGWPCTTVLFVSCYLSARNLSLDYFCEPRRDGAQSTHPPLQVEQTLSTRGPGHAPAGQDTQALQQAAQRSSSAMAAALARDIRQVEAAAAAAAAAHRVHGAVPADPQAKPVPGWTLAIGFSRNESTIALSSRCAGRWAGASLQVW